MIQELSTALAEERQNALETGENPVGRLRDLNPSQMKAVLHDQGPLLIVAGAGTGKTTVLTRRIAHLITSKRAFPREILALTFTDKAAREMEDRVDRLVPYGFNDVWISTFHSFGDRILREYAFEIGMSPNARVLSLPEAVVLLSQRLFEFKLDYYRPLSDPTRFVESLLTVFSRAKDEDVSPEEFLQSAQNSLKNAKSKEEKESAKKMLEVARAYQTYENLKTQKGLIDFGDQVVLALKILRERANVRKKIQAQFKYILVDEFQDTNYAQFEILKLLTSKSQNITVVGDDDQSIYKFRGACLSNILQFRGQYPLCQEIVLQENYRSTQEVLDTAYKLIQHNNPDRLEYRDQISKFLRSHKTGGQRVSHRHFETLFSETEFVVSQIQKRVQSGQTQPGDFAILVRTNAGAEPFLKSLNSAGIPWRFSGSGGLYEQEEIRVALAFLRCVDQPNDSASLYYLATSSLYGLDGETCARTTQLADKSRRSLEEVFRACLKDEANDLRLEPESQKKIESLVRDLKKFRQRAATTPTGFLLYQFFEESGVLSRLAESRDAFALQQAQNLHRFFEQIKQFGQICQYDRVHFFVQHIEALKSAGEDPVSAEASWDENAVNLLTVHAAKGLEFPVVFLVGLEAGHFPIGRRTDPIELPENLIKDILSGGDAHLQEERRLFYVGLTRAQEELILCSARDMGKKKLWKISQFVLEALDKPQIVESVIPQNPLDSLKSFATQAVPASCTLPPVPKRPDREGMLTLSVTSIDDYLTCPLRYHYAHILKIPVPLHHTSVFGMAIHEALKGYHLMRRENRTMGVQDLLDLFKNAWKSEGFVSREHEEKRVQEGIKILKAYHKKEEKSSSRPTLVEESFKMILNEARIRGRFDRVDVHPSESVVIDYKTKDVKDQKDADKKAKESIQLVLYARAFQDRFGRLPDKTALHFIKKDFVGVSIPTEERIGKALELTRSAIEGVRNNLFPAKPAYHCQWCPFEKICPETQRA